MPTCGICGCSIPEPNMLVHSLHCTGSRAGAQRCSSRAAAHPADPLTCMSSSLLGDLPAGMALPSAAGETAASHVQQPPAMDSERLQTRISSDIEELSLLHEVYGWVPGKEHVRPTPAVRAQKELLLSNLSSMWSSPADWVFHHVFASPTSRGADGKRSAARPAAGATVFAPNPFPYDVPRGTEHWVFWMGRRSEWPEVRIAAAHVERRRARGGQFVCTPTPKCLCRCQPVPRARFWNPTNQRCCKQWSRKMRRAKVACTECFQDQI